MFHIVWMLEGRDFAYVPYIAETGTITEKLRVSRRTSIRGVRAVTSTGILQWDMSSQVKYGTDGKIYALHQLHKARRGSLRMALPRSTVNGSRKRNIHRTLYVLPLVLVSRDLRLLSAVDTNTDRLNGEFVSEVQDTLKDLDKSDLGQGIITIRNSSVHEGLSIEKSPEWLLDVVSEMHSAWNPKLGVISQDTWERIKQRQRYNVANQRKYAGHNKVWPAGMPKRHRKRSSGKSFYTT